MRASLPDIISLLSKNELWDEIVIYFIALKAYYYYHKQRYFWVHEGSTGSKRNLKNVKGSDAQRKFKK